MDAQRTPAVAPQVSASRHLAPVVEAPTSVVPPSRSPVEPGPDATLSGWGRLPVPGYEVLGEDLEQLSTRAALSRGLGRSYGDSALPAPGERAVVGTRLGDRILAFDEQTGVLRAEAGLSLHDLLGVLFPRGWFVPVTPGTTFVTLGGMVASDVHGKNHHVDGTFGEHVRALKIRVADGRIVECTPEQHDDLFWATVGGMGLTGHILEVEFTMTRIPSAWIWMRSERVPNIEAYLDRLAEGAKTFPMTMGWIDCLSKGKHLGRGIFMGGRWATADEAPKHHPKPKRRVTVPFVLPGWLLNPFTMRAFNEAFYWKHIPRVKEGVVHP